MSTTRLTVRIALACVGLGALSLLLTSEPTYDPFAWILWGREIVHGQLDTLSGPSWKPLPMFFTVPFGLFGDAAPNLWLVVARAGGFLAIALAYRLGTRVSGRWAGVIAALALTLASEFVRSFWRGNSEGLLVAVCLWAVEAHLAHRRTLAFAMAVAAGLLRPEVWPFLGLYGLWLAREDRACRRVVAAGFALTALAWFVPEYIGSGNFLRAAERARQANIGSPALAAHPFFEVLRQSLHVLALPVMLVALAGVVLERGRRVVLVLGAATAILMFAVAAMTQAGFAGNLRYVALPAALVCILAGAGAVSLVRRGGPLVAVALLAVSLPLAATPARNLWHDRSLVLGEAIVSETVPAAIAHAGGIAHVNACGGVFTNRFQVPVVAWVLHRHLQNVEIFPYPPGTLIALRGSAMSRDPRFAPAGAYRRWVVRSACS